MAVVKFIEIKRLPFKEEVDNILEILDSRGIIYTVENTRPTVDTTFSNSAMVDYIIKVKEGQVQEAIDLLEKVTPESFIENEYYMDSFSDEELKEVISMQEDWNQHDLDYAKKMLEERGIEVDEEEILDRRDKVVREQTEPVMAKYSIILVGYICSFAGGWIGLLVAMHLKYKTKEIADIGKVPYYKNESRKHGDNMLIIFAIWAAFYTIYFTI